MGSSRLRNIIIWLLLFSWLILQLAPHAYGDGGSAREFISFGSVHPSMGLFSSQALSPHAHGDGVSPMPIT